MNMRKLERTLAVVDRALRREFPTDFHKRCMYAAFAIKTLLRDQGIDAQIVGGDFASFVISPDLAEPSFQGFGYGEIDCSHFWVETEDRLIDLGPSYLPLESREPIVAMPAAAWELTHPLPNYLRYRAKLRFPEEALMNPDPAINARNERFIEQCRARLANGGGATGLSTWILTSDTSLEAAAKRKDRWAIGASKFETWADPSKLPF